MIHKDIVKDIQSDIAYLEDLGLGADEIWDSINLNNYGAKATEQDKVKAFEECGYSIG